MVSQIRCARHMSPLLLALALAGDARGQTYTWGNVITPTFSTPETNYPWSTASNWVGGVAPSSGTTTDLVFNSILDAGYRASNDIANPFVVRSMTFNNQGFTG